MGLALKAQSECSLSLFGHIHASDATDIPSDVVSIYLPKTKQGVFADGKGDFAINDLCPGAYEVVIKYLGYRTVDTILNVFRTIHVDVVLASQKTQLTHITVKGRLIERAQISTAIRNELSGQALEQTRGLSLGESLKGINGVNSIQTGPSISKPVIHGVYGDRILILNNGVRQEGQQWGNDHAPEIDPFIATKITVIKGAASIRYGSDALGGAVLVEPKDLRSTPGVDGEVNLVGMTNGNMGAASGMVEGTGKNELKGLSWRLQGTSKKTGNAKTAHYFMKNTGFYENDYSADIQYSHANWGLTGYYSQFYTKIGIASASATGSVQDLQDAMAATSPIEKATFTYATERPYQKVNHKLFKTNGFIQLQKMGKIELMYARQKDIREEYDRDISWNDSLAALNPPDLYFQLITNTTDMIWDEPVIKKKITGSIGINFITQGNLQEHTAYQELVPNFRNYGGGAFIIEKLPINKFLFEGGYRYDFRWLRAYKLDPNTLIKTTPTYNWSNSTVTLGATYSISNKLSAIYNFGTAWRPPEVIELFANGIHQSAASFEKGDTSLTLEKSYDNSFSLHYESKKMEAQIIFYYNYYHHYIYAQPDLKFIQTLQGAFPSYTYTQVNASFAGTDLNLSYQFLPQFMLISKTSLVRARNNTIHDWLINVPADRYDNTVRYTVPSWKRLENLFMSIQNTIVSRQSRVPPNSDFQSPPPGYVLWSADIGCLVPIKSQKIEIELSATNLTNVSYRDYLNRFRYYMDDLGRNISLRIRIPFGSVGEKTVVTK